jgi:DNA-directed RNA polymerase specialized sigma24 family protein
MRKEGSLTRIARDLYSPDAARREDAARQLWHRFAHRLEAEVRRRLTPRLRARVGVEDVALSAYASFCAAQWAGGPPRDREELWRRLVRTTVCKVANTANYHGAQCRDFLRDVPLVLPAAGDDSAPAAFEPAERSHLDPAVQAVARLEFERLLGLLPADLRDVLVMRLEGHTNAQIAARIGRVERVVELRMKAIRALLGPHVEGGPPGVVDEPTRT